MAESLKEYQGYINIFAILIIVSMFIYAVFLERKTKSDGKDNSNSSGGGDGSGSAPMNSSYDCSGGGDGGGS